ncbi:hypothetical protein DRJ23_04600 [Candidatus Acetothermia bacterium]|nr:MAG: hypothetical protein DRJ23_04600 [Candidatus Acetothermia bacterium]
MSESLVYRVHALQRMFERGITEEDVRHVLETGEVIERYPDDRPYPSRLVLGWREDRPLHVVVAEQAEADTLIVITVYEPDPTLWEDDFKRRRR